MQNEAPDAKYIADTQKEAARRTAARKAKGNLFPDVKPEDGQIVMATKSDRLNGPTFMAQYKADNPGSQDGAFYSNSAGAYSVLEGTVDFWVPYE